MKKLFMLLAIMGLAACAGTGDDIGSDYEYQTPGTPTVDYIEGLDVYTAPHKDSFLNQLAMNYRSYAIYNARTSGFADIGEVFAQKAVAAFSGETPYPETPQNWPVDDEQLGFELHNSYGMLVTALQNDAAFTNPDVAAEAQAKFDCWLTASSSGQFDTANECRGRFERALGALDCGGKTVDNSRRVIETKKTTTTEVMRPQYPETRGMSAMGGTRARDGVIVVNNVNVPEHLINPQPVQPITFNQNIFGGDKTETVQELPEPAPMPVPECDRGGERNCDPIPVIVAAEVESGDYVTRTEFVDMMLALRAELAAINSRLDKIESDRMMIKVQQIPSEPTEHIMEEVFEIQFDFDKAKIKPEYKELIRKLATTTQNNRNVYVTVVGHTDTSGSNAYNYALGERRAQSVAKMLAANGIPSSQIVTVSKGETELKVQTPDGTPKRENRRVTVNKTSSYMEYDGKPEPLRVEVIEEY